MSAQPNLMEFNCYVLGSEIDDIFSIVVDPEDTVHGLRHAITAANVDSLQDVSSTDLKLWAVSIPVDDSFSKILEIPPDSRRLWNPTNIISTRFPSALQPGHIHLLIEPPPLKTLSLMCYILGDEPNRVFPVEIATAKTIVELKNAIKAQTVNVTTANVGSLQDDSSTDLKLWAVSIPVDDTFSKIFEIPPESEHLSNPADILSTRFPSVLQPGHVHLLVEPPPPKTLSFMCYILGDEPNRVFPVEIATAKTIVELKNAIKAQTVNVTTANVGSLQDDSSTDLELWAVSIPVDDTFSKIFEIPPDSKDLLDPLEKIFAQFPSTPQPGCIHILIEPPPPKTLTLACNFLGDELKRAFCVEIASTKTVNELKIAIKAKGLKDLRGINAELLDLWAVSILADRNFRKSVDELDLTDEKALLPKEELLTIFRVPLSRNHVHIIIKVPPIDKITPLMDMFAARVARYDGATQVLGPLSSLAKPTKFAELQTTDKFFACCRPPIREPDLPLALLDHSFATFLEESQTKALTGRDYAAARDLMNAMCKFYETEEHRACALRRELTNSGIHFTEVEIGRSEYKTDGHVESNGRPALILEVTNEMGFGDAEPSIHAMLCYNIFCIESKLWGDFSSCHPCFIAFLAGPYLGIGGCVLTDRPTMEIFSIVALNFHESNAKAYDTLARHLSALGAGVNSLVDRHSSRPLHTGPPENSVSAQTLKNEHRVFPYPTTFTPLSPSDEGKQVEFTYVEQVRGKPLIFVGEAKEGRVCIKFVQRYGEEVHSWCSKEGFAPRLLGFEKLPGGWFMVVMEHLDKPWIPLLQRKTGQELLRGPIHAAITRLHQEGHMVHGDVRNTNIMVKKTGGPEFMLVDFDWAGRIGEVNYPKFVNMDPIIGRPHDVEDCTPICPVHDDHMFQRLFS